MGSTHEVSARRRCSARRRGVAWLIKYATEPDDYYGDGTTHWEHASNGGGADYAVGALVVASAMALLFIAMGLVPRLRRSGRAILAAVAYVISLYAGFFCLTVGH